MCYTMSENRGRKRDGRLDEKPQKEFEEVLLEVRRVTRVTTGGRQLSFRAIIVIGNRKGKISLGVAKGADVSIAVKKATHEAYKNVITVPITEQLSVPYEIVHKYKAARVKLLPAAPGTGLKAGSSVRTVLALAGYNNILSKIMGTNNKLNNAIAAIQALEKYKIGKFPERRKKAEEEATDDSGDKKTTKTSSPAKKPTTKKTTKKPTAKKVDTKEKKPATAKKSPAKKAEPKKEIVAKQGKTEN